VNAICDYVHDRIIFGYANASPTKRILAITLCRCMNIPACYCTGYPSEIGVPLDNTRWISAVASKLISAAVGSFSYRESMRNCQQGSLIS
jgi:hypothetical protein